MEKMTLLWALNIRNSNGAEAHVDNWWEHWEQGTNLGDLRYIKLRSSHWRCSVQRGVPKYFVNFTGGSV